jgi:hypothetical protein
MEFRLGWASISATYGEHANTIYTRVGRRMNVEESFLSTTLGSMCGFNLKIAISLA